VSLRFLVSIIVLAIAGSFIYVETLNRLTVTNESGQPVHNLIVTVCGETIGFGDISPGDSKCARFRFGGDATFLVRGRLADGAEIDDYVGYVASEESLFGVNAVLTIRPRGELEFSH
jgi:hypothetical protein